MNNSLIKLGLYIYHLFIIFFATVIGTGAFSYL